ncbi:hypothetical protein [Kaarinaea lacus]
MRFFPTIISPFLLQIFGLWLITCDSHADEWDLRGHIKYQLQYIDYPGNSLFNKMGYNDTTDQDVNIRVNAENHWNQWDVKIHYELIGLYSDSLELYGELPDSPLFAALGLPSDDARLFNFTHVIVDEGKKALVQRLDRLSVGYTTSSYVIRFGRDAVSWGNGLLYNPMDFFNPFAPTAVDKEYKTGDDMLYGQWLYENGSDLQGVVVPGRDPVTGDLGSNWGSSAVKYHGFFNSKEYDILLASHLGDGMLAGGLVTDWRDTVIRGDITLTNTEDKIVTSAVANISYSWIWWNKNISGFLEYFYSGFGQKNGNYDPLDLAANTELMERLLRGELFTLGRNYLAGSLTIEATPLVLLTPTLFVNLDDSSALFQFTGHYDWKQNLTLLYGFALPIGPAGTEFGGIQTGTPDTYLSSTITAYGKISYFF